MSFGSKGFARAMKGRRWLLGKFDKKKNDAESHELIISVNWWIRN